MEIEEGRKKEMIEVPTRLGLVEVKEGRVTKIRVPELGNQVFVALEQLEQRQVEEEQVVEEVVLQPTAEELDKGKVIAIVNTVKIHENVAKDVRDTLNGEGTYDDLMSIMRKWYRGLKKESSQHTYLTAYRKHFGCGRIPRGSIRNFPRKKRIRRKPVDAIGFDKTYGVWIKKDNHQLVIRALHKYMFKATTDSIVESTRLKKARVLAILHYMLTHKEATKKYDENQTPVYHAL